MIRISKKYLKPFVLLLSFTLFLNMISPSIALAQTTASDQKPIENLQYDENGFEVQPMFLGLIARVVIQGGSRLLKVFRGNSLVTTHKLIIHSGKQGKHIIGHSNFIPGRSVLRADANALLKSYAGKGKMINENKERVDLGKSIGDYYNPTTKHYHPTNQGIIHYSKTGAYIVPAAP
ncbi:polymorphic toxin type 50 domain-containing protein [Mammaliicoccus sciuri]|uniref:Toxin 50 n=1 Tax=Sporosarcina newyorkensis TaxID=759851 RepID=A0A1T4XR74_9BACL|nr:MULTISPECIES: polymorphic toxin type 50 domain-containing protein [Sporosarcina]MBY0222331.1 hypothetical protein [Sporosarcina aquimarina]SKA92066.1 toxin 50 [Sporosarcina newyorkensis]